MRVCPVCQLRYHDSSLRCLVDGAELEEVGDPRVGSVIGGRYVLEGVLGEGGMATVYQARNQLAEQQVAVKILHPHVAEDERLCERLRREARAAAAIAHDNVVRIFDLGQTDDGAPYLAMELLDGPSLRALLKSEAPLDIGRAVSLGKQIAVGLARGHDLDVVHRDLKPANVIVVRDARGKERVKIVDFGLARSPTDQRLTLPGTVVGTPQYMAPERLTGAETTASADLYALGVVLFEMVAGRHPFDADSPMGFALAHLEKEPLKARHLRPEVPKALDALIENLLEKDPADRPVDAHAVVRELSAISAPPSAPPPEWKTTTLGRRGGGLLTFERWHARLELLEHELPSRHGEPLPPAVRSDLEALRDGVERLRFSRHAALDAQGRLEALETELQEERGRIGHAVHVLALDLSSARGRLRTARERLAAAEARRDEQRVEWLTHDAALAAVRGGERGPDRADLDRARSAVTVLGAWQAIEEALAHHLEDVARAGREEEDLGFQIEALRGRLAQDEKRFDEIALEHQRGIDDSAAIRARLTPSLLALVARLSESFRDAPEIVKRIAEP